MLKRIFCTLTALCLTVDAPCEEAQNNIEPDCSQISVMVENKYDLPVGLLLAIIQVESRKKPWAVNNKKQSKFFGTLEEAVSYIEGLENYNKRNISIGYMQIHWRSHKNQFPNVREAFSPQKNIEYGAKLLKKLYKRHGSWEKAIMWYNPKNKKANRRYFLKVANNWKHRGNYIPEPIS